MLEKVLFFLFCAVSFVTLTEAASNYTWDPPLGPNDNDSVNVYDNASYPFYFYTISANKSQPLGLRYGILDTSPFNAAFQINTVTGQVYIDAAKSLFNPPIEFEREGRYVMRVLAFDANGRETITGTLTVNIIKVQKAPKFLSPIDDIISLNEGTTLPVVIYTATATCVGNQSSLAWAMDYVSPTGNGTLFGMDVRGRIYLINPAAQLNYSVVQEYVIFYFALDKDQFLTSSATLTVRIIPTNRPPVIKNLPNTVVIPPNIIAPTPFFFLDVADPDDTSGGNAQKLGLFKYSFSVNPIEGFPKFEISRAGTISTVINQIFNYTSQPWYLVTIFVTDWDANPKTATGVLNVTITESGSNWVWSGGSTATIITTTTTIVITTSEATSSDSISQNTIIGAVVGVIGGLMAIGGLLAASLLCCKGRAAPPVMMSQGGGSSSNKNKTTTTYEDEHVYFGNKAGNGGRSAIVSPFPGGGFRSVSRV